MASLERYGGPIRLVPSPEGVQTQGINPQTGQWENLVRATEENTMPGIRPGSDQFFASQVQGLPGFTVDTGTGKEAGGDAFGDFLVKAAMAGVSAGALGGFSALTGGGAGAAAGGAAAADPLAFASGGGMAPVGAGAGGLGGGTGLTGGTLGGGGGTGLGLTAPATLGTGAPSLGFGLTPDQVGAFGGLGGGTAEAASGIANTAAGGGSFLGGTSAGSLGTGLAGLGTAGGLSGIGNLGTGASSLLSGLSSATGGAPGAAPGGGGPSVGSTIPGLLALAYAAQQPGADTSQLQSILAGLQGNQNPLIQAAQAPLLQSQAAGYGDLLQSQGNRGIRGSSFGDTDIANFLSTTGQGIANAGANAAQGSLALQGNLAGQISGLGLQNQQIKNNLYGTAFDVLGRGLNPGSYGAAGSTGTTGASTGGLDINALLRSLGGGLGSIGSGIGSGLASLGSGLGSFFGGLA